MWALRKSGVTFRKRAYDDGTFQLWQQPKLPTWEVPRRDPAEPRPRAPERKPEVAAAEIAELAPASDDAAGEDLAA